MFSSFFPFFFVVKSFRFVSVQKLTSKNKPTLRNIPYSQISVTTSPGLHELNAHSEEPYVYTICVDVLLVLTVKHIKLEALRGTQAAITSEMIILKK